jgi:hypothetical protein
MRDDVLKQLQEISSSKLRDEILLSSDSESEAFDNHHVPSIKPKVN